MENNSEQQVNTKLLYGIVADTMPMEGRDFTLTVDSSGGKPTVSIKALTDIGRAFAPLLAGKLAKPMADTGVGVASEGSVVQEVLTVRRIREKVEAEAAAARRAKIEAAKAHADAKRAALEQARKARIGAQGEKAPESQDERAARRELKSAAEALERLTMIDGRVGKIRAWVDERARAAAAKDMAAGRSWAVDMDAPLTTQFDRDDATAKLAAKEDLIGKIAEHAVEQDFLGWRAIDVAKQYITQKK